MTHKEFFGAIEGYYGKYPRPFLRDEMARYIWTLPEPILSDLYKHLKYTFSTQFNSVPDIEAIEKARREMRAEAIRPHVKRLPDPTVKTMPLKQGQLFKMILDKVSMRRIREKENQ